MSAEMHWVWSSVYSLVAALMILIGFGHIRVTFFTKFRRQWSPTQRRINALVAELSQHRADLADIPIMDEFAAHMRKKRIVDKLSDEIEALVRKRDKEEMAVGLFWALLGKSLWLSFALYVAHRAAGPSVATISAAHFWPFNYFFAYPCDQSEISPNESSVSLFSFVLLLFFSAKAFHQRVIVGKKVDEKKNNGNQTGTRKPLRS